MRLLAARLRQEDGFALSLVVVLTLALVIFSVALVDVVTAESSRSSHAVTRGTAFYAAEAGVNDYLTKLVADRMYYVHEVAVGEATRRSGAVTGTPGTAWTGDLTWAYPNGKNTWRPLGNGYEYDLEITPPSAGSSAVRIVATGRPVGSTNTSDWRVVETLVRQASVTDFQMLANADISYGPTATTYGKIYAGIDSSNVKHNVNHQGTAYADIFAEGNVTGSPSMRNGARTYNSTNIRSVITQPINFNDFLASLADIQRASQAGGVFLNNATVSGWKIVFSSNGTFTAQTCMRVGTDDIAKTNPTCGAATVYNVPSNGAIYIGQSAIVSGTVNGRVTIASNDDVVIGGNIDYAVSGDDVLGLVAANDMWVAQWTPNVLNWRAATISTSGAWKSWSSDNSHTSMTFTGSTSTNLGGGMTMFQTRTYQYDDTLLYLQPPWFPTIDGALTIVLQRELPTAS